MYSHTLVDSTLSLITTIYTVVVLSHSVVLCVLVKPYLEHLHAEHVSRCFPTGVSPRLKAAYAHGGLNWLQEYIH